MPCDLRKRVFLSGCAAVVFLATALADVGANDRNLLTHSAEGRGDAARTLLEEVNFFREGKFLTGVNQEHLNGNPLNGDADTNMIDGDASTGGLIDGFFTSLCMILISEVGDETFIIAALMAMRHPRSTVLAGGLSALFLMTILSTALGFMVPNLISRQHTNNAATILYTFFGLRLLYIAWKVDPRDSTQKEVEEVEDKLEGTTHKKSTFRKIAARFCTPIFLEAFILIFLAEWGDRSQIATIALAAHKNPVGVTIGAFLGHSVCTTLAVIGGRLLALRISQRSVALTGSILFLVFAMHSFFHPPV